MVLAEKQYLTTGDAAKLTGWTAAKVRALCESGRLPAVNTSTAIRPRWTIRRIDLEAFLTPGGKVETVDKPKRRSRLDSGVRKIKW